MFFRSIFSTLALMLGFAATIAHGQPLKPSLDRTLANGMRVLVYENPRAPTALHMVWVKAGSLDEVSGRSGLAHVLEHMMFKGTQNLGPGSSAAVLPHSAGEKTRLLRRITRAIFSRSTKILYAK